MAKNQSTSEPPSLIIGQCYFVRTVTDYWVGRLAAIGPHSLTLTDASWVAVTGRLSAFMRDGKAQGMEIEPVGAICVQWLTWSPWPHDLFTEVI